MSHRVFELSAHMDSPAFAEDESAELAKVFASILDRVGSGSFPGHGRVTGSDGSEVAEWRVWRQAELVTR